MVCCQIKLFKLITLQKTIIFWDYGTVFFSFRFADSNQARQRKKKKMTELKKKLREKVLQYNTVVEGDPIDEELACSLTEGYILPWERHKDGMICMNC